MPDGDSFELRIDPMIEAGVYAHMFWAMFNAHEMTLDCAAAVPRTDPAMTRVVITARVRIPPTAVFALIRELERVMTGYESRYGEIRRLDADVPLFPPEYPDDDPYPGDGEADRP